MRTIDRASESTELFGGGGLLVPPAVPEGGRVAVIAPSGPMLAGRLEAGLAPLRAAGFELVLRDDLLDGAGSYLAGSDARRHAELRHALLRDDVDAVVCVRGGYGSMRILGVLQEPEVIRAAPKRLTGFSDITALHLGLAFRLGWASLHGPMPFNFAPSASGSEDRAAVELSVTGLVAAMRERAPSRRTVATGLERAHPGRAKGPLLGGNLTLVEALYRSPFLPSLRGALLFVEDVGESPYRLDRLVTALRLRGADREVAGVVLGSFTGCSADGAGDGAELAATHFAEWGVPVAWGVDAGHHHPNQTLWHGVRHCLDADEGVLELVP